MKNDQLAERNNMRMKINSFQKQSSQIYVRDCKQCGYNHQAQSVQHWEKNVTNVEEEIILAGNVELKIQTDLGIKDQKHDK